MDRQATGRNGGGAPPAEISPVFTLDTHLESVPGQGRAGCALGAQVATMEGLLPVEYLALGDRIITRSGARVLRGLTSVPLISNLVRVAPGALGHDRPGKALVLGAGTEVLVRDWRAQAMFGAAQVWVPVARLVDGQFITRITGQKSRLFTLHFDAPEVIYVDGVEIGCKPLAVRV